MIRDTATRAIGFFRGLVYPFRGMRVVYVQHRDLVRIWMWPVILMIVVLGNVLFAGWVSREALLDMVWPAPGGEGAWASALAALHAIAGVLVAVATWVVGGALALALTSVIAAPFNDLLSEAVEKIAAGREGNPFSLAALAKDLVRSLRLELTKIVVYLAVMVPLLFASFAVPVVGQALYTAFGFVFTALYFAIDYVDWPASRRGHGIRWRARFAQRNLLPMLGFGTAVWALLFIPVLNLFLMPAAVAGGTLLFLDLERESSGEAPNAR